MNPPIMEDGIVERAAKRLFWCMNSIMHDHEENWRQSHQQALYRECASAALEELQERLAAWSKPLADGESQTLINQLVEAQTWMQREEFNGSVKSDPVYSTLYGRAAGELARLYKVAEAATVT